jgi:flavin reductase (DIM6/NTAB) family NADH-FMN oxidoreductase RutF
MEETRETYGKSATEFLEQLARGAFLTVRDRRGRVNTMTIGWGSLGYMWSRPILTVLVRPSRYTYELIEDAEDFTVSLPLAGRLTEALELCGSRSGRDLDKFAAFGLTAVPGRTVKSPVIGGCDLYYECSLLQKQTLDPVLTAPSVRRDCYPDGDLHTLYFGLVEATYRG